MFGSDNNDAQIPFDCERINETTPTDEAEDGERGTIGHYAWQIVVMAVIGFVAFNVSLAAYYELVVKPSFDSSYADSRSYVDDGDCADPQADNLDEYPNLAPKNPTDNARQESDNGESVAVVTSPVPEN